MRVRTVCDAIMPDLTGANIEKLKPNSSLVMLLATFEEIAEYLKILLKFDILLERQVKSFGSDEEKFLKWNETLRTCCIDLDLHFKSELFDENQDLRDFDQDLKELVGNLKIIFGNTSGESGIAVDATKKLLGQQ